MKVIGRSSLIMSFDELGTLLTEVKGVINARPLTYVYDGQLTTTGAYMHEWTYLSFQFQMNKNEIKRVNQNASGELFCFLSNLVMMT